MNKRNLGNTDIAIAPLVFGGNVFGWTADKETSFALLDRFVEAGFNAIDTADTYSAWVPGHQGGESESILGEWMKSRGNREKIVLITKVGMEMGSGGKGLSAEWIERSAEGSLKRLQTDYIDVYFSHIFDESVPVEESLEAYDRLIKAGKVRVIGASNHSAEQLRGALELAKREGLPRYEVLQPEYNLYDRGSFEGPLAELAIEEKLGVIPYFALASGFLTGKYRSEADLGKSPRGGGMHRYLNERGFAILSALDEMAATHKATPAEVAIAWLNARPGVTAAIASATSLEQLESLIRATQLALSEEELSKLTAL